MVNSNTININTGDVLTANKALDLTPGISVPVSPEDRQSLKSCAVRKKLLLIISLVLFIAALPAVVLTIPSDMNMAGIAITVSMMLIPAAIAAFFLSKTITFFKAASSGEVFVYRFRVPMPTV